MLDVLANIAQILGFGLQSYEALSRNHHPDAGPVLATLHALADTSTAWKDLHTKYHSLNRDIQSLVEITTEYRGGQRQPKHPADLAPSELRRLVYSGTLSSASISFAGDTRKSLRRINEPLDSGDPAYAILIVSIRKSPYNVVAGHLEELNSLRADFLSTHSMFLDFLKAITTFQAQPSWTQKEVKFFIDQRSLLDSRYPNVIAYTDRVLMTFLDMFIEVSRINSVGR